MWPIECWTICKFDEDCNVENSMHSLSTLYTRGSVLNPSTINKARASALCTQNTEDIMNSAGGREWIKTNGTVNFSGGLRLNSALNLMRWFQTPYTNRFFFFLYAFILLFPNELQSFINWMYVEAVAHQATQFCSNPL